MLDFTQVGIFRILIVIAYIYVMFTKIGEKEYIKMILLTGAVSLILCKSDSLFMNVSGFTEGMDDEDEDKDKKDKKEKKKEKKKDDKKEDKKDDDDDDEKVEPFVEGYSCGNHKREPFENSPADIVEGLDENELIEKKKEIEKLFRKDVPFNNMSPYDGLCLKTGNTDNWLKNPAETPLVPDNQLFSFLASQGPLKPSYTDNSGLSGPPVDGVKGSPEKMFMLANNRSSPECCPATFSTSTGCVCTTKNQRDYISTRGINDS